MPLPQTLQLNLIVNHRKVSQAETNHHKMSVALAHFDAEYMLYIAVVKKKKKPSRFLDLFYVSNGVVFLLPPECKTTE